MALKREYRPPLNSNELKYSKILSKMLWKEMLLGTVKTLQHKKSLLHYKCMIF